MAHLLAYGIAGFLLYLLVRAFRARAPNLNHIPTVGPDGPLISYLGALRYLRQSRTVTLEGCEKYRNGFFKVALKDRWMVFCCGSRFVEDIRKASDDHLNLFEALDEMGHTKYTLGEEAFVNPFHVSIIRTTLTRNLGVCFPDILDEITKSFDDILSLDNCDWKAIPAAKATLEIICRTSNRLFVGLPLCRDPDYLAINSQFTIDVVKVALVLDLFPKFLRPIVGPYITRLPVYLKRTAKHLAPIVEEYLRKEAEYGKEWPGKSNTFFTWLLDAAEGSQRTPHELALRILSVNFAAIHTTSMSFTHALYHLAADPQYAQSLREEAESVVNEHGWTKAAVDRMPKVDSFLKESQRFNGTGSAVLFRKVLKDFTFSDGTVIPARTILCAPLYATHHNEEIYDHPDVFDPSRFTNLKEYGANAQLVTSSQGFLTWGLGKHSCPGRHFAANELKAMLAHVVISYDVKLRDEGVRPPNEWYGSHCIPNRNAQVLFRKRQSCNSY